MLSTAPDGVLSDADARAWIVRLLDRVDAGDAHAFCETDDAPAEVLSAAWLGFGPPPPPGDDGDEGAERSVREAPTSGPACWLRLERALGRCARCADAYHRRVDAWNDEADLEDGLGGDEDAAVLAALLRERADARLVSRARDVRATLEKRTRERDPRSDRDTTPPDVLHAFLAVCREALAVPGCSRAPPETFDAVGAAVVAAERAPDAFDALLASRVGRADATERRAGLLRLLAHPSSEIRRVARRLFEGGRRDGGDVSARDGEASSRRRFVERVSEESAEAVDEWAATAWDAFAERQRRIREDEHASDDSRDASRNALRAAWEALAIATARMRPSARAETLARRPETLAAALDDIGGSDDAVVALAARCVAELVGGGGDVGWDSAGIPPATAVDVLEAAARKSPNETTHLAVVAAMGATLASASTARGATESNDDAYDGTNRASAFLCRVAPNSPHLFSDVVAWEARRAAVDAFRAGYLVARPSTKDHTRLATIRAMEVSARGDTRVGSGSATSVDASRIAARRSAAAAVAVMIRADAAALAALERRAAGCADDDDEDASRRGSPDDAWDVLEFAAFQWEDGDPSDGEASAVGTASRVASREATAAAFSARLVATSERAWRPSLEAYAETYAPGTTRPAGALHALADDPATVHAVLVAAAELASSPPPNSRASRVRFGVDPDASSRDATRLAEHLAGFIRRLAESSGPLARARAPFEAIRAAVAAAMGTRETLRAAARAALRTQALGAGTREFGPRVWASVCAVPEATLAALRGATDAARNAATLADPADLLAAAAPALFFGAAVARAAEAAAFKSPESRESTESAASAIRKLRDASWSLARRVVAESSRFAADGWAQGDLVRALQSIPATFSSRRRRPKPAEGEGDFLADLVAWGGAPLTSASARHWADATDACVADASPAAREAARDAARMTLANLAGGGGAAAVLGAERVQRLAAKFPEDAPGNLGRGSLEKLPSKMDEAKATAISATISAATKATAISAATSSKSRTSMQIPVSTTRGSAFASELASEHASDQRRSIRDRLATRAVAPSFASSGGFRSDPLDAWNGDRGGFAGYPPDDDEPDVGDARGDDDDDVVEMFEKPTTKPIGRGVGGALGDGAGWHGDASRAPLPWGQRASSERSPYERQAELARARETRRVRTNADILANVRAGGPTHTRVDAPSLLGNIEHAKRAKLASVRADADRDAQLRERAALAEKRAAERERAKAAREERAAERLRSRVINLDREDGSTAAASAAAAADATAAAAERRKSLVPLSQPPPLRGRAAAAGSRARFLAGGGGKRVVASRPEPPWVPPALEDVVGAALRWSLGYAAAGRDASPSNLSRAQVFSHPPASFASPRAYVEHFAPLLLAELRAQVASAMEESGGKPPGAATRAVVESTAPLRREPTSVGRGNGGHVGNVGDYHHVRVSLARAGVAEDAVQENDLVLLERRDAVGADGSSKTSIDVSSRHALGWVEGVETGGSRGGRDFVSATGGASTRLRVRVCLVERPGSVVEWLTGNGGGPLNDADERLRRDATLRALSRQGADVVVSRVASLSTSLREFAALLSFGSLSASRRLLDGKISVERNIGGGGGGGGGDPDENTLRRLNAPQRAAVLAVANARSPAGASVVLVQGPPGTGKTHTIAAAVDALLRPSAAATTAQSTPRRRVLVCAQSNSAVDELVARLALGVGSGGAARALVRLGREDVVREDALPYLVSRIVDAGGHRGDFRSRRGTTDGTTTAGTSTAPSNADASRSAEISSLQSRLERLGDEIRRAAPERRVDDAPSSVHLDMLNAQRRRLLGELAVHRREEQKRRDAVAASSGSVWSRVVGDADVVCATLSGAGLLAADRTGRREGGGRGGANTAGSVRTPSPASVLSCAVAPFDAVVIDEAAQATEPATLIPLRWLKPGGVAVLVGDPRQLAPTLLSRGRVAECLGRSLFERLQLAGAETHLLSVQYRMAPRIRAFPSTTFYGGKLVDGTSGGDCGDDAARNPKKNATFVPFGGCSYACVDVADSRERRDGSSIRNDLEVDVCLAVYAHLQRAAAANGGASVTVGIVSPYRGQLSALKFRFAATLARPEASFAPVEFATVDGVQGREFDVVVFSCVRACGGFERGGGGGATERRAIGFLADARRLNVALTRPRKCMVVVGHRATLSGADATWKALWDDARARNAILELRGVGAGNLGAIRDAIFDSVTGAFDGVKRGDTEEVHVRVADTPNVEVVDLISDDDEDEDIEIVLAAKRKGETANVVGKRRRA